MAFPIDPDELTTSDGRERLLDRLGAWFVDALPALGEDRDAIVAHFVQAITAFYDIRESADQPRGMYAGHFFLVDAVGLDDADRPVPWAVLAERIGRERLEFYQPLFDAAERVAD